MNTQIEHMLIDGFPRRARTERMTPQELELLKIQREIEGLPEASEELTACVTLLSDARSKLADHIENVIRLHMMMGREFQIQINRVHWSGEQRLNAYTVTTDRMTGLELRNVPPTPIGPDLDLSGARRSGLQM